MKSGLVCPKCGKNKAKLSRAYPEVVVCYCEGEQLQEVGSFINGEVQEIRINLFDINPGDMVSGIDKSYTRSIYMVLENFEVLGWKSRGLLLKMMSLNGVDYSREKNSILQIRPEQDFEKISLTTKQESLISKKKYSEHKNYSKLLKESKIVKAYNGDIVGVAQNKYKISSGKLLGSLEGLSRKEGSKDRGVVSIIESFFLNEKTGKAPRHLIWSDDLTY